MKTVFSLIVVLLIAANTNGQQITRQDVNSGGLNGILANQNFLSYTIGGIGTNSIAPSNSILKIGFQQFDILGKVNIKEAQKQLKLTLYPNPTSDYIHLSETNEILDYQIFSADGKLVKMGIVSNSLPIDIKNIASGVYLFHAQSKEKIYQTQKIFITY